MYFQIVMVYKNTKGKQVGCLILTDTKIQVKLNMCRVKNYFKNYECINAVLLSNGTIKGKKGYHLKYEVINVRRTSKRGVDVFTADTLKSIINSSQVGLKQSRNFVDGIYSYCLNIEIQTVLGIVGLRGVGKTTGVLQAISKL